MSRCQASVTIGGTTKPIEVLFSTGAAVSYISEGAAAHLRLPVIIEDTPTTLKGATGEELTCRHTASIDLTLGTFQHVVDNVEVVPGSLPYLVLGSDWFRRYDPRVSWREGTFVITSDRGVKHTIETKSNFDSTTTTLHSVEAVDRI